MRIWCNKCYEKASKIGQSMQPFFCVLVVLVFVGGCSKQSLDKLTQLSGDTNQQKVTDNPDSQKKSKNWGKAFVKNPKDATISINYAKNLLDDGKKNKAFQVLQTGLQYNPKHEELVSEYGRLAIRLKKPELARRAFDKIENPTDWRIFSAKGTLHAKKGDHKKAHREFEKALALQPNEPSVVNNLALSYALSGAPKKGETLLRTVMADGNASDKMKQNLALILSLQGRFDDAQKIVKTTMSESAAQDDINYLRKIVKKPVVQKDTTPEPPLLKSANYLMPEQKAEKAENSTEQVEGLRGQR